MKKRQIRPKQARERNVNCQKARKMDKNARNREESVFDCFSKCFLFHICYQEHQSLSKVSLLDKKSQNYRQSDLSPKSVIKPWVFSLNTKGSFWEGQAEGLNRILKRLLGSILKPYLNSA